MFAKLFGKKEEKPKPKTFDQMTKEEMKEFQTSMRKETRDALREVDRQIWNADRLINEAKRDLEKKIKEGGDRNTLKMLAQNVMRAQGVKDKHLIHKTKVQQIEMSITEMTLNVQMAKTMGQASQMIGMVNSLANIPELSKNVQNMQMQMEKMGIVGEMVEDAMDMGDEDVELDDKAQALLDQMENKHKPQKNKNVLPAQKDDLEDQLKKLAE